MTGPNFVGRAVELDVLLSRVRNRINVVVSSPRRYGKTSLLLRLAEVLRHQRPAAAVVTANAFLSKDLATFASRLVGSLYSVPGGRWHRVRQAVPEFLQRLRVRPSVEFDGAGRPSFSFGANLAGSDAESLIADVYAVLAAEAERRPAVLVLDEFQEIIRHGEHLPFLLKGLADAHPEVSVVLAGSRRHLVQRLVTAEGAPLYGMAQRLALEPIPRAEMAAYLQERAAVGGKPLDAAAADLVVDLAGPVPNDIQHLAFEAFEVAGSRISQLDVEAGLERTVAHESDLFAERLAKLSPGQSRVLATLAGGAHGPLYSAGFARAVGLAGGQSVRKAIDALAEDETLVQRNGRWEVGDPFYAAWLRALG